MKLSSFFGAGIGGLGAQLISLVCLPVLTRLYSPSAFAPWAIGMAFITFIGAIATLRYDLAVVTEREREDASALFWVMLLLSLVIFIIAVAAMAIAFHQQWLFYGSLMPGSAYIVSIWLLIFMATTVWTAWHLHHGAFWIISTAQLSNAVILNAIQLLGATQHSGGTLWLVIGSIVGQLTALTVLVISGLRTELRPLGFSMLYSKLYKVAWKHRRFVLYSLPFTFFGAIRERMPIMLLGSWVTSKDLGLYSQAWRLSNVPAGLTGSVIRPVLFHSAASGSVAALEIPIIRILKLLLLGGIPLLAVIAYRPEDIFAWLLGEKWRAIGPYLATLVFPGLAFTLSNWLDRLLDAQGKQQINLWTEMVCGISSILGLILVLAMGGGLFLAVVTQAALLTLNYLFFIVLSFRVSGYQLRPLFELMGASTILFLLTSAIIRQLWPLIL